MKFIFDGKMAYRGPKLNFYIFNSVTRVFEPAPSEQRGKLLKTYRRYYRSAKGHPSREFTHRDKHYFKGGDGQLWRFDHDTDRWVRSAARPGKRKSPTRRHQKLHQNGREYYRAPDGSWWIYDDTLHQFRPTTPEEQPT